MMASVKPQNAKLVGKVKCIRIYPFKSLGCIELGKCECSSAGLISDGVYDRHYMIILAKSHNMVTARMQPKLVKIKTKIENGNLVLEAEGKKDLILQSDCSGPELETKVWGQKISGIDMGDEAASWIEEFLSKPAGTYRVIYNRTGMGKRIMIHQDDQWSRSCKMTDEVTYADGFPYLLISTASLEDLSKKVSEEIGDKITLPMQQFRPNIEVEGCQSFAEDSWKDIYIGDVKFSNKKLCGRCVFTTVDPIKGEKRQDGEPLKTLKRTRPEIDGAPAFGINLVMDNPGIISAGDEVYATVD